jgi:two-component system LytT family sensor kinase
MLDEDWQEVVKETLIAFPLTVGYVWAIYFIRKWVLQTKLYKNITAGSKLNKALFWFLFVTLKVLITSIPLRMLVIFFFDDDGSRLFDVGFLAICVASFLTILFVYLLESFLESESEKQKIKVRMSQYEYEKSVAKYLALKKQLNPHFLFNSFNSLAGLIEINHKKASYFIEELSNVYRYTLTESEEMVVSLQKELQLIHSYINLQKIRHGESLKVDLDISTDKLKWLIPPMTLELLIENAIKHNTFSKKKPLEISIRTENDAVLVKNQYRPKNNINEKDSMGIGTKSLIKQYEFIHELKPVFTIQDQMYIAKIPLLEPEL